MTRQEFIERSLLMGVSLPLLSSVLLQSCGTESLIFPNLDSSFKGNVIIIGAGAAGMYAGYLLKQNGIEFKILEASSVYGGRLKKAENFANFPLDLGAEWIHVDPKILGEIANKSIDQSVFETIDYNPQTIKTWKNGKLKSHNYIKNLYSEWKFKRSTWFDFFEQNIVPEITDSVVLNKPVLEINYEEDKVITKTADNESYEADKILVTVPIKMLQNEQITFQPEMPQAKREAIGKVYVGDGIKIFIEFNEKFYPDILSYGNIFKALTEENKFVYDAAFKKDSDKNILGLFAINEKASAYTKLNEQEIISKFLSELDEIFEGKATTHYKKHIIQNWSKEPYIQGAYSYSFDGNKSEIVNMVSQPLMDKVYFAGEALSEDNQAMVQGACESAYKMIARMIKEG
ncbi:MAG: monoamine oxidase [Algoriphagus marincola HL-49]|uniref:Tryptophan 2-monooxygenase n=1 Tax=Algoriphagus marincola HL-49 TaxID=1305737 RepID=A0A0P8C3C2_9BACT|nr:MAG: monoamine oxidase [Algoriphagus marincola HL-49]